MIYMFAYNGSKVNWIHSISNLLIEHMAEDIFGISQLSPHNQS